MYYYYRMAVQYWLYPVIDSVLTFTTGRSQEWEIIYNGHPNFIYLCFFCFFYLSYWFYDFLKTCTYIQPENYLVIIFVTFFPLHRTLCVLCNQSSTVWRHRSPVCSVWGNLNKAEQRGGGSSYRGQARLGGITAHSIKIFSFSHFRPNAGGFTSSDPPGTTSWKVSAFPYWSCDSIHLVWV